ncbi:MAG: acyl-CoA desaturase [Bacteroidota bacterium]|nr:acyl-CoA desaturase [Bacteroidota bacterium]
MKPQFSKKPTEEKFWKDLSVKATSYFEANGNVRHGKSAILWKGIVFFVAMVSFYLLLLNACGSLPWALFFYFAFGLSTALAAFNFAHDACHQSLTPNKKLNDFLFYFLFNLQGASAFLWKKRHLESHHVYANVKGADADLEDTNLIRLHPASEYKWWHRFQSFYAPLLYLCYTLNWIFYKDFRLLFKKSHASLKMKNSMQDKLRFFGFKISYLLVFLFTPWYATGISFLQILVCFLLMHGFVSLFVSFTFLISHYCMEVQMPVFDENKKIDNSWMQHQVEVSVDFHAESKWAIHIFGGFNTHVAHHLFPSVCHEHYPALTIIIKSTLAEYEIPYHQFTFFKGVISHFKLLKKLGKRDLIEHG